MRVLTSLALAALLASTAGAQSLTAPPSAERAAIAHVRAEAAASGVAAGDVDDLVAVASHVSSRSGAAYVYVQQRIGGIDIAEAVVTVALAPDGRVTHAAGTLVAGASAASKTAGLSASAALSRAAILLGVPRPMTRISDVEAGAAQKTTYGEIAGYRVQTRLVYVGTEVHGVRLAWEVTLPTADGQHLWVVRLDARTGEELQRFDLVVHDNFGAERGAVPSYAPVREASGLSPALAPTPPATGALAGSYAVFAMPVESPTWITPFPTDGRTLEANPDDATASPFGWHDTDGIAGAEFTDTRGNNTDTYTDIDGNNVPDAGSRPDGGAGLVFDAALAPLDLSMDATTYRPAAVVNLFYWTNIFHDVLYQYGFDEAAGNFQTNNYGNGGVGGDPVLSEAQNLGNCNANFATPSDGASGRMQMFTCDRTFPGSTPGPLTDSDLDNGVIVHEYAHGLSNRLVGGPGVVTCLQNAEQMGEGWSDWYGLMLTQQAAHSRTTLRPIGNFLMGQPQSGEGIRGTGLQPPPGAPYTTDFGVNSATYGDTNSGLSLPHGIGFVWATILWEATWDMIDAHGFSPDFYDAAGTAGNQIMLNLVTEAMKGTACSPGFVDARDAILAADVLLYPDAGNPGQGLHYTTLWNAFARRGLGVSASQGSSGSRSDQTEAFDTPGPPPVFAFSPSSIAETLAPGAMTTVPVTIENQAAGGGNDLNWTASIQNATVPFLPPSQQPTASEIASSSTSPAPTGELRVSGTDKKADDGLGGNGQAFATGGPDGFGYTWIDSNEIGGPTYSWVDISATGTLVPLSDDDWDGPFALPFGFPFYGTVQTEVYIGSNGFLSFGSGSTALTNQNLPNTADPDNLIAMLWDDLDPDNGSGGSAEVRYQDMGDGRFVVSFIDVPHFPDSAGEINTFQAILYDDGSILFQYDTFTDDASAPNSHTIGIENSDGTIGLNVVYNAAYVANNLAVQVNPPVTWITLSSSAGSVAPGGSEMFDVELDATGLADGTYTADVVINTNDPVTPTATIPVTLTVDSGGPPPTGLTVTVDAPATVDQGGTLTYDVTVFNGSASAITGRVFTEFENAGGTIRRGRSFGGTIAAGQTVMTTLSQAIPPSTPTGTYTVRAIARDGGGTALDTDEDMFDVVSPAPIAAVTAETPETASLTVATNVPLRVSPNPVRGEARFTFGLADAAPVHLALYDALGREVAVVAAGDMAAGSHTTLLRTGDLPAGVYVWRLMAGDRVESGRITVAR